MSAGPWSWPRPSVRWSSSTRQSGRSWWTPPSSPARCCRRRSPAASAARSCSSRRCCTGDRKSVVIEGIGGCNLGSRNLDFHYRGFARLGATVDEGESQIRIKANRLRGAHLYLDTPSHTGTENLIMAASLAPGTTVIDNTALEPEVLDVIAFLTKMGAHITGGGTGFVTVRGVSELTAVEHTVMPDRIDAAVFAMAAALTGGELSLVGASLEHF